MLKLNCSNIKKIMFFENISFSFNYKENLYKNKNISLFDVREKFIDNIIDIIFTRTY